MQNCGPQGSCHFGFSCNPSNCNGCCDENFVCSGGSDIACGHDGTVCDNCAAKNETCVSRTCSTGSTCPGPYLGCASGMVVEPPQPSRSCSEQNLAAVVAACTGSAKDCLEIFGTLPIDNPTCGACLYQFLGDQGVRQCLAPYLSRECNHDLTCAVDCAAYVCAKCPAEQKQKCEDTAGQPGGACNAYVYGWECELAAFQGPGAFCNWDIYEDAGHWLNAVARHYCQ
jgi:hypothetical protein